MANLPPPNERLPGVLKKEIENLKRLRDDVSANAALAPLANWQPIADQISGAIRTLEDAFDAFGAADKQS